MRNLPIALVAASALVAGTGLLAGQTAATPIAPSGVVAGTDAASLLQNVQFYIFGGRRYCWYDSGWNGPGWYWCGYAYRRGLGWGGGYGWHGWGGHERREFRREERRDYREDRQEHREDRRDRDYRR